MALRNPYSDYSRRGDEQDDGSREALLAALDEPQPTPMQARPRTPVRTPTQTRDMLSGPGGQTQAVDTPTSAFSGDRFGDERQEPDVYQPPSTTTPSTPSQTGAQSPAHTYNPQRGYELMDAYDDPYSRRMEGSPGYGSSAMTGAGIGGSIVPGAGHVVGALAGVIGAAFAKNAETAMTDFAIDDAKQIIAAAHKDAFGRDIDPAYLNEILQGQGWQQGDRWMGQDSLAYVLDAFAAQAPGERAAQAAANAAAAQEGTQAATPAGAAAGANGGGLQFSGFDFNRAQDPSKSAKDAFAAAAQKAPPMTDTSKAGAEAWFREHIAPQMEAAGYKIYDLQGDKAWVGSKEDPEGKTPVDWLINAGGSNPQIGWQPDDGGGSSGGTISGTSGAKSVQDAYAWLKQNADPSWSREQMQAAINAAFADVPGFVEGYAGDAVFQGGKLDLITNFGGPGASWSDSLSMIPLHGGGGGGAVPTGGGTNGLSLANLAPGVQLAAPLGRGDVNQKIQEELQRIMSGAPPRDELLEALG
jgi:hypothetical protein